MRSPPPPRLSARPAIPGPAGIPYHRGATPGPGACLKPPRPVQPGLRAVHAVDTESRPSTAGTRRCSRVARSGWSPTARVQEPMR